MIVEFSNKFYQVSFVKKPRLALHKKKLRMLIDTSCSIIMKEKPSDLWSEAIKLCWGESKQYITDKYSKVIGKKHALLNALDNLPASLLDLKVLDSSEYYAINNKAFRTALWKKFHETFGAWK